MKLNGNFWPAFGKKVVPQKKNVINHVYTNPIVKHGSGSTMHYFFPRGIRELVRGPKYRMTQEG